MLSTIADLVLRRDCVCCGRIVDELHKAGAALGADVCADCMAELSAPWQRWFPPAATVPVWAAGPYGGPRRTLVISAKDRLRPGAIRLLGRLFDIGLRSGVATGLFPDPRVGRVALLPAPTRVSAAKARGGDIVVRAALEAKAVMDTRMVMRHGGVHKAGVGVFQVGVLREGAQDSVGLNRQERLANIAANVRVDPSRAAAVRRFLAAGTGPSAAVIVDDVCTTGATVSRFAVALAAAGITVDAVVVIAAA